jgi:thiol-disulfide isomerase/thioredoxin/DNA-binding beta-propeller fold protein YncE
MSDPIHAPELDGATAWLNTTAPLTLKALRGKLVLLDFWTYGCVNCMHVLPDLKKLEAKYGDELVVIGVHSPKFDNEKSVDNLRRIVERYGIRHPVAQDTDFRIWRAYTVRAWPTLVLIDPAGYIVATAAGEGHGAGLDQAIAAVIAIFDERGELDRRPIETLLTRQSADEGVLRFPGKVLADAETGRLIVADSNHHRVCMWSMSGEPVLSAGAGRPGLFDGPFEHALFDKPQGLALAGDTLYVADTGNHALRAIDLASRTVSTIAGTGRQGQWGSVGGAAHETSLVSPWDLLLWRRLLFIAMAGVHQVWMLDLGRRLVFPYAGNGPEARVDGSIDDAAFAQPSGLASDGEALYVADAESNIIRRIALPPVNQVETLAGGNLFEFGDRDGVGDAVRLQHPLGVAWQPATRGGGRLFIADTYNHRIKVLDPATRRVTAFAGSGEPGHRDGSAGSAQFYEPGGLSLAGDTLYVADTNNHAIRAVDVRSAEVRTVALR